MTDTMEVVTQNPYSNAGQATVNGFFTNLRYGLNIPVEELNRAIATSCETVSVVALADPFSAAHPAVAGRRNKVRVADDDESIPLGPVQEIGIRQHANARTMLRSKKK